MPLSHLLNFLERKKERKQASKNERTQASKHERMNERKRKKEKIIIIKIISCKMRALVRPSLIQLQAVSFCSTSHINKQRKNFLRDQARRLLEIVREKQKRQ